MNQPKPENSNTSNPSEVSSNAHSAAVQRDYELDNVQVRPIGMAIGGLVVMMLSVLGITALVLGWIGAEPPSKIGTSPTGLHRETSGQMVSLDPDQPQHLDEMRRYEEAQLTSYGWIDKKAGIARIPIERAMQIVAEQGFTEMPLVEPEPTESEQEEGTQDEGS